jgi:type II secretory pathway pseudopilin PulG
MTLFRPAHGVRNAAFSLLELMIVLGVLATVLTITWPRLRHRLRRASTEDAAHQVALALRAARLSAIEQGEVHELRYVSGEADYEYGPARFVQTPGLTWKKYHRGQEPPRPSALGGPPEAASAVRRRRLTDGITFFDPRVGHPVFSGTSSHASAETRPDQARSTGRSPPILFYPDGRSTGGYLELHGADGDRVAVRIRALTGGVRIRPVKRLDPDRRTLPADHATDAPDAPPGQMP